LVRVARKPCAGKRRDGSPCAKNALPGQEFCDYHERLERKEVVRTAWGMGELEVPCECGRVLRVRMPAKKVSLFERYMQEAET
jgi:hypothetical protein